MITFSIFLVGGGPLGLFLSNVDLILEIGISSLCRMLLGDDVPQGTTETHQ